jgi:hypothetical protein
MIRTIEATIDEHGNVRLREAVALPTARQAFVIILDEPPSPLAALYAEFADEDRAFAEEGIAEYKKALAAEDTQLSMSDDKITVWRLITHHTDPEHTLRWVRRTGRLAIGWGRIGHIGKQGYLSPRDISEAISEFYPGIGNAGSGGACLYNFYFSMRPGDLVILSIGGSRSLVMEVEGGYEFKNTPEEPPIGDYQHQRKASILPIDPDALWHCAGSGPIDGQSIRWALVQCRKPIDAATKAKLAG